jgi:hypothetical protein
MLSLRFTLIFVYIIYITFGHFASYRDDDIIIVTALDIIGRVPGSYVSPPFNWIIPDKSSIQTKYSVQFGSSQFLMQLTSFWTFGCRAMRRGTLHFRLLSSGRSLRVRKGYPYRGSLRNTSNIGLLLLNWNIRGK